MRNCITRTFTTANAQIFRYDSEQATLLPVGQISMKASAKATAATALKLAQKEWPEYAGSLICAGIELTEEKRFMTEEDFIKYSAVYEPNGKDE